MRRIHFLAYFIKLRLKVLLRLHHTANPLDFDWRSRHWHGSTSMHGTISLSEKNSTLRKTAFFRTKEIEMMVKMKDVTIPMFLILGNTDILDEKALMDLGMKWKPEKL